MVNNYVTYHYIIMCSRLGDGAAKEEIAVTLLQALIPMCTELLSNAEGVGFPELMVIMATLADAGSGRGHIELFTAATRWLNIW